VSGAVVAATLGCACVDGAAAGWSSPREHPVTIGDVDIKTAAATINGIDRLLGLASNFIFEKPRRQLARKISLWNCPQPSMLGR